MLPASLFFLFFSFLELLTRTVINLETHLILAHNKELEQHTWILKGTGTTDLVCIDEFSFYRYLKKRMSFQRGMKVAGLISAVLDGDTDCSLS